MPIRIRDTAFSSAACEKLSNARNTGDASLHRLPAGSDRLHALNRHMIGPEDLPEHFSGGAAPE